MTDSNTDSNSISFQLFKWSTGEKYEQSTPVDKMKYDKDKYDKDKYDMPTVATDYNSMKSLLFEDGTESCMRVSNKREDANTKLNERSMIESISQNPFLPRNNYINDLQIQDEFLKPRNSNSNIEV
jgi:hypothetical protein